jgi:hypothetical protein
MHIRALTFFNAFATSRTKRERRNAPVGTALYNSIRWIIRRLGSSFTTPDKRNYNIYENNQKDALNWLIYYSKSVLHVLGEVLAHHQEHLTVSGSVHPSETELCGLWGVYTRLAVYIVQFQLIRDTSRQQLGWTLPDTVNTVKCSWWWVKTYVYCEAC